MKYPKLENIKSRDDSDSWQVGFGQGLRPKDAPAAWTAAILPRWLAFVAANPSLRYSRHGGRSLRSSVSPHSARRSP